MIFKLWYKLVVTMVIITSVVLILALFISDHSVKKGFLSYINQVEAKRLDNLALILIEDYQEENSWGFIRNPNDLWRRFGRQPRELTKSVIQAKDNAVPLLHELATRAGEEDVVAPPDSQKRPERSQRPVRENKEELGSPDFPQQSPVRPQKPRLLEDEGPRRNERPNDRPKRDRGDKRNGSPPPPPALALLDVNKEFIEGSNRISIEPLEENLKPLVLKGKTIGYLQSEPFTNFTDDLDKQFIQYQNNAFLKISLLALGLVLLGAALFAGYLRARINKIGDHAGLLTSGDFSAQKLDKSNDEIGQLSHKLDVLGRVLENNQLERRRWVSDISHELRTPVAVLQGEIEAIQDGIREMNSDSVNSLHNETLRLSRLVTDLHQLSLSDNGALKYEKKRLNIVELTECIIRTYQSKFDEKNITVSFDVNDKAIMINGDGQRLEQLFSNLANNSLHYTQESGKLNIGIRKQKESIIIEWSDSKPGVTDDELSKLFERLYRVDESRNRNAGGSGLGLSICKNIVESHDGSIIAQHSPLGGINFMITFPAQDI